MKRVTQYQTNNGAYISGKKIKVKGLVIHSYGTPQPNPMVLVNGWNNASAKACVHEHIGKDFAVVTLPCFEERGTAARGWHAGGAANNTHIGVEMTEPATIKYTGGSTWVELGDGSNTKAHVLATYKNAVEEFAALCKFHNLDPLVDGVILSHKEAHKRGLASNHGDPEHLWKLFGLSTQQFRQDVRDAMYGKGVDFGKDVEVTDTAKQEVKPLSGKVLIIYEGEDGLNIRKAPSFTAEVLDVVYAGYEYVVGISADEKWYKLSIGGFISASNLYTKFVADKAGSYYRVRKSWDDAASQIGAYTILDNAVDTCKNSVGYHVYDDGGNEVYPLSENKVKDMRVRVKIENLRVRKGPGTTYDYHKAYGGALHTGLGVFTIAETTDGPGAKQWGLLKGFSIERDGWIALDEDLVDFL